MPAVDEGLAGRADDAGGLVAELRGDRQGLADPLCTGPRTSSGKVAATSAMFVRYPLLSTDPMRATPIAPPTSRTVSLSADATPCCSAGSDSVIATVEGVMIRPMPIPMSSRPGRTDR